MPGGFPTGWDVCAGTDYGSLLASTTLTLLTGGAANVMGAWTSLGTLAYNTNLLAVTLGFSTGGRTGLMNIGIGAPGSQRTLFTNIPARAGSASNLFSDFFLPCDIPAGTQLWAQIQSSTAADVTHFIKVNGYSGAFTHQAGAGGGESIGVTVGTSSQFSITSGANAYGTVVVLSSSTPRDFGSIVVVFAPNSSVPYFYSLGIGASGSEVWIVPNQWVSSATVGYLWLPIAIKAGTRVAIKCSTAAGAQVGSAGMVGIYR